MPGNNSGLLRRADLNQGRQCNRLIRMSANNRCTGGIQRMKYLRRAGQWLFLRLEKVFSAVFGDRLNPLYHLGAIAYFMTWWPWPAACICTSFSTPA